MTLIDHAKAASVARCDLNTLYAVIAILEGGTGNAYAIPTKDKRLNTLPLDDIQQAYIRFWKYASARPDVQFLLTPFGTGLAGYSIGQIREIMTGGPLRNVWETGDWKHG